MPKKPVAKPVAKESAADIAKETKAVAPADDYKVRVRMYRHGLGDCHLLTFPRKDRAPFQMLIDFGALHRSKEQMMPFAEEIEETLRNDASAMKSKAARLDVVVATHEHKDHLSGFNQAREVFDRMDIGGVWMGWTENPKDEGAKKLLGIQENAAAHLRAVLASPRMAGMAALEDVRSILEFSDGDDTDLAGRKTIAHALAYLRKRGEKAKQMKYLEPGQSPVELDGVEGVRVYVLGPPRQTDFLLRSDPTKKMQKDEVVYHLARGFEAALAANVSAARNVAAKARVPGVDDPFQPFACEHRLTPQSVWWSEVKNFIAETYDDPEEEWRRIDNLWLGAFDQLALKLTGDVNNTSLVLAFELVETGEVLLYVGDAQVGNWLSWANVEFKLPNEPLPLPAHDLLRRTVFYKVGHHASHNATLAKGGLKLMTSKKLVAFVPLDMETAKKQGRKNAKGTPKGWEMPAKALRKALELHTSDRLVISDVNEKCPKAAKKAGVRETPSYYEFRL